MSLQIATRGGGVKSRFHKRNQGFTLIELLAVIIILAIIALITTPIILNIINKSKKNAFTDTAYGIIESARLYYTDQILEEKSPTNKEFKFEGENELKYSGTAPKGGSLILTNQGEVTLAIHNGTWCATKAKNESKVHLKKYEEDTCILPDDIEVPPTPEITGVSVEEKMKESTEVMSIDPDHNPRYVGANPNNYVIFNNELWRIIGVFGGETKIIRNEFYNKNIAWDDNLGHGNNGYNDWSISTLQVELNESYLDSINENDRKMINETHLWNLGGASYEGRNYTRANFYNNERGTSVYSGHATTWIGAIGLMYASDYGYSTSATDAECDASMYNWTGGGVVNCKNNNWLYNSHNYQWTLSTVSDYEYYVFHLFVDGQISHVLANDISAVSPVLYLKQNVKITDGIGSETNPFEISI